MTDNVATMRMRGLKLTSLLADFLYKYTMVKPLNNHNYLKTNYHGTNEIND